MTYMKQIIYMLILASFLVLSGCMFSEMVKDIDTNKKIVTTIVDQAYIKPDNKIILKLLKKGRYDKTGKIDNNIETNYIELDTDNAHMGSWSKIADKCYMYEHYFEDNVYTNIAYGNHDKLRQMTELLGMSPSSPNIAVLCYDNNNYVYAPSVGGTGFFIKTKDNENVVKIQKYYFVHAEEKRYNNSKVLLKAALKPIAFIGDVATFPIQFLVGAFHLSSLAVGGGMSD